MTLDEEISRAFREAKTEEKLIPLSSWPSSRSPDSIRAWERYYSLLRRAGRGLPSGRARWRIEVPAGAEVTSIAVLYPTSVPARPGAPALSEDDLREVEREWSRTGQKDAGDVVFQIPRGILPQAQNALLSIEASRGWSSDESPAKAVERIRATTVLTYPWREVAGRSVTSAADQVVFVGGAGGATSGVGGSLQHPTWERPLFLPIPFSFDEPGVIEGEAPEFLAHAVAHGRLHGAPRGTRSPDGPVLIPTEGAAGLIVNPHRSPVRNAWWKVKMGEGKE